MNPPPADRRPRWTFSLATLFVAMVAIGAEVVALKNAEAWGKDWGEAPAAAICVAAGAAIGMIELRHARGFGTLRGRLFQGAIGGTLGGAVFACLTLGMEWYARNALGEVQPPWTVLATRLGLWLLWGGLAGALLGAVVDVCLAPRRRPLPPRSDPRAGAFLASLPNAEPQAEGSVPEKVDQPEGRP